MGSYLTPTVFFFKHVIKVPKSKEMIKNYTQRLISFIFKYSCTKIYIYERKNKKLIENKIMATNN